MPHTSIKYQLSTELKYHALDMRQWTLLGGEITYEKSTNEMKIKLSYPVLLAAHQPFTLLAFHKSSNVAIKFRDGRNSKEKVKATDDFTLKPSYYLYLDYTVPQTLLFYAFVGTLEYSLPQNQQKKLLEAAKSRCFTDAVMSFQM